MASRAERIEDAARALLAASSRIEAETMCVVPRRLVDALRAALAAQPAQAGEAVAWRDSFPPTHYCRECKALWRRWPDGSWSLVTAACRKCCDNVPMGEQIVALGGACAAPASAEAVADSIIDAIVAETRAHLERMERLWGDLSRAASSLGGA